jgi:hypothetical protein
MSLCLFSGPRGEMVRNYALVVRLRGSLRIPVNVLRRLEVCPSSPDGRPCKE